MRIDLNGLLERIGYTMLIQMIIEGWNEVILLILLSIAAIGIGSDKADELRKRVMIPMTRELVFLYLAAFFYNLFDIIIHLNLGVSGGKNLVVLKAAMFGYYFIGTAQTLILLQVVKRYIADADDNLRLRRLTAGVQLIHAPCIVLLVVNLFIPLLYYFDGSNNYIRGRLFAVSYYATVISFLYMLAVLIIRRKSISRFIGRVMLTSTVIPLIAFIINSTYRGISFNNISVSITALILFPLYEKNKTDVTLKYGYELEKAKSELAENRYQLEQSKNKVLISQIQPHFIYNALMAIREQCIKYPEVYSSVTDFSHYLRANLEGISENMSVTFENELRNVEAYLALEKLNFGERLKIEYDIESRDFLLPELSVQPLVENAVRHGIGTKEKGGTVRIVQRDEEERIIIEIIDDGEGNSAMTEQQEKRRSVGIENVRARLKALNKGELEIIHTGSGTTARMIINEVHYEGE